MKIMSGKISRFDLRDRHEETRVTGNPGRVVRRKTAARDHAMQVRVVKQVVAPGMVCSVSAAASVDFRNHQTGGYRLPQIFFVMNPRRELNGWTLDLVIRHLTQQMMDAIQARALLVDCIYHPPLRLGDMRAL